MKGRLFVSQTSDGIKEAFEERSELSTAHYKSGGVLYNAPPQIIGRGSVQRRAAVSSCAETVRMRKCK